ncbi:drug efflux protein [Legionella israelensis]|uniref:TerC family protein n=1 Tax=Legionella israelensis TaxID=454 RepID=UPI00088542A9|nr:TerC family protein [Legionella israelensis]QBS10256.1 TerC family protein [Legionella israelensis]SCY21293.1 tellurite resistance protein TerC [Legionella israelensis DSM 19235]STX59851.1 drug efflux protein [Legionella israelensis]
MSTVGEWWMWLLFLVIVTLILGLDIFALGGRKAHRVSTREALFWSSVWVATALLFNILLWWYLMQTSTTAIANKKALEFFTGYLVEKSLSTDNIFVFLMIFNYFAIPAKYQRRVLLYGVLGAIFMRLIIILMGIWLIHKFEWILYLFGAFLLITGLRMLILSEKKPDLEQNLILRWMRHHFRITDKLHKERFFIRDKGLFYFTPLFLVLVSIEISDLIFAVDSIPAIFAITHDPFIVFTSNIFAILGLRALYFLLANLVDRFQMLKYGIAVLLAFIGFKMLLAYWIEIPILIILTIILTIIMVSIFLSLINPKQR